MFFKFKTFVITFFSYQKLEFFLSNFSFLGLFLAMLAFWVSLGGKMTSPGSGPNFEKNLTLQPAVLPTGVNDNSGNYNETKGLSSSMFKEESTDQIQAVLTNGSTAGFVNSGVSKSASQALQMSNWGEWGILGSNLSLFGLLSLRWLESGHFPLSNLYESLMFLSWALTFFHLALQYSTNKSEVEGQSVGGYSTPSKNLTWLGAITAPTALFTTAFANFSLPLEMQRSSALVPALQSNWLMMHVTVMILSYAALIFGCLLSIGFLILTFSLSSDAYEQQISNTKTTNKSLKVQWAQNLDNLSYRMLGLGFPLLTIGILSGAVWANEAWGSYWSWDPKETWALLTWLVFAIYLHTRITKNWQGKKPAMIASFGFFVVWVCYLGVNLLGEGLHSYGWLSS